MSGESGVEIPKGDPDALRGAGGAWDGLAALLERKPPKLVAVALANKTVRIAWKLMTSGERYDPTHRVDREGLGASQYGGLRAEPLAPSPTGGDSHAVAA